MSDVKGMYIGGSPTYFKDETAREFISDIYDETKTYAVDSYCIHENKLYKCTTETTGGFDGSCWKETNMSTEMVDHTTAIDELNKNMQNLYMPKGNYKFMVHWGKASNDACRCCLPYAKNPNDKITLVSSGFQVWDSGTFNICFYTTNTNLENTVDYIEFTIS